MDNKENMIALEDAVAYLFTVDNKQVQNMATFKQKVGLKEGKAKEAERLVYNEHKRVYLAALDDSKDKRTERARHKASILRPDKHRAMVTSGLLEGSLLHQLAESERKRKGKLYAIALDDKLLVEESGLSEADFITLSKAGGWIASKYKVENTKGNLVLTSEGCKQWLADRTMAILQERGVSKASPVVVAPPAAQEAEQQDKESAAQRKAARNTKAA